jgi:glycosyltransferase involved in cell wall biosynthesis
MRILQWMRMGDKFGSLERYSVLLARECKCRGHELVLMHDVPNTVAKYHESLHAASARYVESGDSWKSPIRALRTVAALTARWKPDIVHTHFINPLILPALRVLGRARTYLTFHSAIEHRAGARTRLACQLRQVLSDRLFAVSERVRNDCILAGVSPARIATLYLGLDIDGLLADSDNCLAPVPKGYGDSTLMKVITVGRFWPVKGMISSIKAAIEVLPRFPEVVWWVVGKEGPDTPEAVQLIEQSSVADRIVLLGQRNDVPALMRQASLQVVGSRSEGLGLVVLEAAVLGIPTVAPNIGGIDEAVDNCVTGLLVPPSSNEELARAAAMLLANDEARRTMGARAKHLVRERFDARRQVSRLLDLYERDLRAAIGKGAC